MRKSSFALTGQRNRRIQQRVLAHDDSRCHLVDILRPIAVIQFQGPKCWFIEKGAPEETPNIGYALLQLTPSIPFSLHLRPPPASTHVDGSTNGIIKAPKERKQKKGESYHMPGLDGPFTYSCYCCVCSDHGNYPVGPVMSLMLGHGTARDACLQAIQPDEAAKAQVPFAERQHQRFCQSIFQNLKDTAENVFSPMSCSETSFR
ncbi:hypothetical protein VTL71DRAFT_2879, partial [Oculimacula yallundae]